jgi:hypothetical protein
MGKAPLSEDAGAGASLIRDAKVMDFLLLLDVLADAVFVATHGLDAVAARPEMMPDELCRRPRSARAMWWPSRPTTSATRTC